MYEITEKQVRETIMSYRANGSILKTASEVGLSTVKVRKILITEGLWESDTSIKIKELLDRGMSTEEIANRLFMSTKNVQAYMPYGRGIYGGEEKTKESARASIYRNRMKHAAAGQIRKAANEMPEEEEKMSEQNNGKVIKLHLELDMDGLGDEEFKVLRKYGYVKNGISRDILVPEDITLHGLNYVILRAFGWQNSHLHNFSLPDKEFKRLTGGRYWRWAELAGIYFRFPTEDFEDIYWDDDYREGVSFRNWLKRKYTGPYSYRGLSEHYIISQINVLNMYDDNEEITVMPFSFKGDVPKYTRNLSGATCDEVMMSFFGFSMTELLERLPVVDVLCKRNSSLVDMGRVDEYIDDEIARVDLAKGIYEYEEKMFPSRKSMKEFLERHNIKTMPVTEELIYSYDYGDNWKVIITCEEIYDQDEIDVCFKEVLEKHRPICIEKDGIELLDDVGGISGFCRMLVDINENGGYDDEEIDILSWAKMMGWTGRRISPKQTL